MFPSLYIAAVGAALLAGTTAWALLERHEAGRWRDKAAIEEAAAEQARLAAKANAATAVYERSTSSALQARVTVLETQQKPQVETRVVTVVKEISRASDAYSPLGATLRLVARRLRELDATGPGAARADAAAQADGAARHPAAAAGAAGRRPRLNQLDIGSYAVQCLGHVIKLEYQIQALDGFWGDMEKALAVRRAAAGAP